MEPVLSTSHRDMLPRRAFHPRPQGSGAATLNVDPFTLAAVASIAAGVSIGAAATVGVMLAAPYLVGYGDRCYHEHCLPCDSVQGCLNKLQPGLRFYSRSRSRVVVALLLG
jgi:hypothetical protein